MIFILLEGKNWHLPHFLDILQSDYSVNAILKFAENVRINTLECISFDKQVIQGKKPIYAVLWFHWTDDFTIYIKFGCSKLMAIPVIHPDWTM